MTNVVNNFGFMAHIRASLQMFEEWSRGKARTETVLQAMEDDDTIVCMRFASRDIEDRLRKMGRRAFTVIPLDVKDVRDFYSPRMPEFFHRATGKIHLDHSFIHAFIEQQLYEVDHRFANVVGFIGDFNQKAIIRAAEREERPAYSERRGPFTPETGGSGAQAKPPKR